MSNPIYTLDGVKKAAKVTGIHSESFLDIFTIEPKTATEAKDIFNHCRRGSDIQNAALEQWNKVSLKEIEEATTLPDVTTAYYSTPPESEAQKAGASKWDEFSQLEVDKAITAAEAQEAYRNSREGSQAEITALLKWIDFSQTLDEIEEAYGCTSGDSEPRKIAYVKLNQFFIEEIKKVTTIPQIKKILKRTPSNSPAEEAAMLKWIYLCQTVAEITEAHSEAYSISSKAEKIAWAKWKRLSKKKVGKITTIAQAKETFNTSPCESKVQQDALDKWDELVQIKVDQATTTIEAKEAYECASGYGKVQKIALAKWVQFSSEEINKCTTIAQAKKAHSHCPNANREAALLKWISLCRTITETEEVYRKTIRGSEIDKIAMSKLEEIIKAQIEKAKSIAKVEEVFNSHFLRNSEIENAALIKWFSLCKTISQLKDLFYNIASSNELQKVVLAKWEELAQQKVDQAKTLGQLKKVYPFTPPDGEARKTTLTKMYQLANTPAS